MIFITHSIDEAIILGDRIAVMSARPGRFNEILDMPFGWPRNVGEIRSDRRYTELREHIWNELRPARNGAERKETAA
jgi:NitT/TauT family transport system ATP-binding protein